jgi:hypothetical protein
VLRGAAAALLAALAVAPAAAAGGYAEIVAPDGEVLAAGTGRSFSYPADGSLVEIAGARVTRSGVTLSGVSLLGGAVSASTLGLPARGNRIQLGEVIADGIMLQGRQLDRIVPLLAGGYMVLAQTATTGAGPVGRVALRIVLESSTGGLPAGTQLLVGLPYAPAPPRALAPAEAPAPLAVLGFTSGALPGFVAAPATAMELPAPGGPSSIGDRAAAIVQQFLGVPYRWAGADPITGFDCSGLALYVYAQLGVALVHYTGSQFLSGTPVPEEALRPGDLVFFDAAPQGPQHEGIYIGGGRFVQAPHTGDVVKISSLADPTYGLRYVGAVRPY